MMVTQVRGWLQPLQNVDKAPTYVLMYGPNPNGERGGDMSGPTAGSEGQTFDDPPLRELTPQELQESLEAHQVWLESGGKHDKQANLSRTKLPLECPLRGTDFRKAYLAGAYLQGADLQEAHLAGADLQGAYLERAILKDADLAHANLQEARLIQAQLGGADLLETNLWEANLDGADLQGTTSLVTRQLAGATLCCAKLPEDILKFEQRVPIEEASRSGQTLFFTMLGACIFSLVSIERVTHAQLLTNTASLRFPFVEAEIQTAWLYWLMPLFLIGFYVYFHLHLLRLWEGVAELPAVFPDGRPIHQAVYLWLLGTFIQAYFVWLRRDRLPLLFLQKVILVVFAWCMVPTTLFWFWLRYLPLHHWSVTIEHIALLLLSTVFGMGVYDLVAPELTVVMSTTVPRDAEAHARDARAASEESRAAAARETPAAPGWSSNDP
jgi:Pentapeptide repeats (8 copies)